MRLLYVFQCVINQFPLNNVLVFQNEDIFDLIRWIGQSQSGVNKDLLHSAGKWKGSDKNDSKSKTSDRGLTVGV